MEAKDELRLKGKELRKALKPAERAALDRAIMERLKGELEWTAYKRVMVFLPIERLKEIDTWPLVLWLWQNRPEIRVYAPLMVANKIEAVQISQNSTFSTNNWGIPEPADGPWLLPQESLSVVLVPLLGFDEYGRRVGYGRGHYDRFLKLHPEARRVGLAYERQIVPEGIPSEKHDVPLHAVATEAKMHVFKRQVETP